MIERIEIRNVMRFRELNCELEKHLLIVGPNNCGKTTLLQVIALWSEIAAYWSRNNPDLARDSNGDYSSTALNLLRTSSILLSDWNHLWYDKNVTSPASIRLQIAGRRLGFELIYKGREIVDVRPTSDVLESVLEWYLDNPIIPVYIPSMSGVDREEPNYDPGVIPARLSRGQAGTVLRNILLDVSTDSDRWQQLSNVVSDLFGSELMMPSGGAEIFAEYRESPSKLGLDYCSGGSGFLQIVMIYATIFWRTQSVILIDEPDAHLHLFLQDRLYGDLKRRAKHHGWQLIIATHSQQLINQATTSDIRILSNDLNRISDRRVVAESLRLDNIDLLLAQKSKCVLYLEGWTDKEILWKWAQILGHPIFQHLDKLLYKFTAEESRRSTRHFGAVQAHVPALKGVELLDRNNKGASANSKSYPEGMKLLVWSRYETENYLIHPAAILRWLISRGGKDAADRANHYMKNYFPPALHLNPLEMDFHEGVKGKQVIDRIVDAAQIQIDRSEYAEIAGGMLKEEIHSEVIKKLDLISDHLNLVN